MSPKTKAILKTTGAVLVGATVFAYLPLISFAAAPVATSWLHMGLAAVHPLLGEALLAGGCLAGTALAIKKTWARYFTEKKLEKKIEQIVAQKLAHRQNEDHVQQKQQENTKTTQHQRTQEELTNTKTKKGRSVKQPNLKLAQLKMLRNRRQHRNAA